VPHGILQVFIIILNENVFQNPEVFPTQVSLSPKQSTLYIDIAIRVDEVMNWVLATNEKMYVFSLQNITLTSTNMMYIYNAFSSIDSVSL
jgi:hypothetical protein